MLIIYKPYYIIGLNDSLLLYLLSVGAEDQDRTGDPSLFRGMLYQLSYLGEWILLGTTSSHVIKAILKALDSASRTNDIEKRRHIRLNEVIRAERQHDNDYPVEKAHGYREPIRAPYADKDLVVLLGHLVGALKERFLFWGHRAKY